MKKASEQSCFALPCSVFLCFWPLGMVILLFYHATIMQLGTQLFIGDCCYAAIFHEMDLEAFWPTCTRGDWAPPVETAMGEPYAPAPLLCLPKKDEVSLPQTGSFFAGMKKAPEQSCFALPCSVCLCFWPLGMVILLFYHATTMQLGAQLSTADCCYAIIFHEMNLEAFWLTCTRGDWAPPARRPWESRTHPRP